MKTGLLAIELISKVHQVPFDSRTIERQFHLSEGELTIEECLRILKSLQFRAKRKKLKISKLIQQYQLPVIAINRNGSFAVLLKVDKENEKLLLFNPESKQTETQTFNQVSETFLEFIVVHHRVFSEQVRFSFNWFVKEILNYKQALVEVLTGSFLVQLFGLVTPLFTQIILDKVIVHRSMTTLDVLAVAFIGLLVFEFVLNILRNTIFAYTANKIDAKLGAKLFKHLFALPFSYFESRQVGNIAARIRELDTIREFITQKAVSVTVDLFFSFVFLGMMLLYSRPLTFMVMGFIAVIAILYLILTPTLRKRLEAKFQMGAQSNAYLVEATTGVQTVKSLALEGSVQKRWENHLGDYLNASFSLSILSHWSGGLSNILQKGMTITILYFGVKEVIVGHLTIGQLIAFQMFAGQLTAPILRLVNLWNEFQQALLAIDRIGDILNQPQESQSKQAITLPKIKGDIRIENIGFRYTSDGPVVLKDINLDIKSGECIGIVGRSGSGKSTITKLVQRLYHPQQGAIYLDDVDIRHIQPQWLRYQIGVVLQDNYLFSGTIRDNIVVAMPDASMDQVIKCSAIAGAHEFVSQFPEGYDTTVGERGSTLSGGQRQRIAIARALISNPKLLIFDEATSALDYESEAIIQRHLKTIRQGRTTLIITHRLSTVEDCDRIVAMDHGDIIESGTHHELIAKQGYYYKLYMQQEQEEQDVSLAAG